MQAFNKFLLFVTGLLSGIIICGATIWYLYGGTGKNIFVVKPEKKEELKYPEEEKKKDKKTDILKPTRKSLKRTDSQVVDSLTLIEDLTADLSVDPDTTNEINDTITETVTPETEDIVIKKDELLFASTVLIKNHTPQEEASLKKDSLLQAVSGVVNPLTTSYTVEFWQSPINYRGYKMGKNKIVLFGISANDNLSLHRVNDDVYFKHSNKVYRLERTVEFKPYEQVNDPAILSQLK